MDKNQQKISLLERALAREKVARKEAERILEKKSLELYEISNKLKIAKNIHTPKNGPNSFSTSQSANLSYAYLKIDMQGNILEMNKAAIDIFGYNFQDDKINIFDLVYREDHSYALRSFDELLQRGMFTDYVARFYTKNGPNKLLRVNANLIYNNEFEPIAVEGIIRDITTEARIRELIEEQRTELSTIINNSPLGIILSEKNSIKKSNLAFQQMLGYTATEIQRLTPQELVSVEELDRVEKLRNDLDSQVISHSEFTGMLQRKDGRKVKVKVNSTNIVDEHHQLKYRLSIIEDITEEARQKEIFEEQKKQLEIIVENSPLGIALANEKGITKSNDAFTQLLGYSGEELCTMSFKDLTYPEDLPASAKHFEKLISGEVDKFVLNKRYVRKNGTLVMARTSVSAVKNAQGKIMYEVVLVEDISEQIKAEQQKEALLAILEKSNRELEEYAHVVSHDLKSPLRSISALISWIREDCKEIINKKGDENLTLIEGTVEKMENLINGILTYSGIKSANEESASVSIDETVKNIINLLYVPDHITITVQKPLPVIYGDPIRLQQLFQNLIINAINYIDKEQGEIIVDYESKEDFWLFSVQDNGIGIPKEYHEKIFGIFQSLHSSGPHGSTGIGLSIVKKIVGLYGGSIYLKSEEGVGTTFYVKLKKYNS